MGKKGKRSAKTGDGKAKQGPGKARRERAAAMKEIRAGVEDLIERLEIETADTELYGPLPEVLEECPICLLPMPRSNLEHIYMACCGQTICGGFGHATVFAGGKQKTSVLCAFCRSEHSNDTSMADYRKRAEKNDVDAINTLAAKYRNGEEGLPKDEVMSLRLHLRAAELGCLNSTYALATHFQKGEDPRDAAFAMQLATIAAKKGTLESYYLLGYLYHTLGDVANASKCYVFAAREGHSVSMEFLRTFKIGGAKVVSDDALEVIEEDYNESVKLEWSEEREAFKNHSSFK